MSEQLSPIELAHKIIEQRLEVVECSSCGVERFKISGPTERLAKAFIERQSQLTAAQARVAELEASNERLQLNVERLTADNARLRELLRECEKHLPQFCQLGIDVRKELEQ